MNSPKSQDPIDAVVVNKKDPKLESRNSTKVGGM